MITKENIKKILLSPEFGFTQNNDLYSKHFGTDQEGVELSYNASTGEFIYPNGVETDRNTTTDEHQAESYVVFLCVAQLLERGYLPHQFKLEGRNYSGNDLGWCDILVKDNDGVEYLIIECKTADIDKKDDEFRKHWAKTLRNGDQLFRYFNTYRRAKYLCLFAADYPEYTKEGKKEHKFENVYHIISLVDNDEYLKTNPSFKSFQQMRDQQGSSDDFFDVWKTTYLQDYNTRGLLEPGFEAFNIGNKSYGLDDLKTVDEYSLEKKYHEFALILRKHTISSHENAFDKLINLFISKIIDETSYKSEEGLKLLWKGAAYDDYFSLQDRLNVLYLVGMKKFFNDDVAYVENKQIDEAFKFLSSNADEGKETIKKYFRKLKYFNNNPFAFLDVHNEQLFYQNAVILKDVINMLQDIYLTSNNDNQFLGDLFEGFLNKGVHQSEGQFFSPIPIVRFLVSSLPLKYIIESSTDIPKAIDYACGSGHFLTEYARQIIPIIANCKNLDPEDDNYHEKLKAAIKPFFEHIDGIEKDYRLSKVSQVAAYMYGMDGIKIHYSDALIDIPEVQRHTYNVLVANPPYSVSGFLETLTEEERDKYTLSSYVSNIEKNNSIETFFIERSEQLLAPGGVATVILPSSILSKGSLYMRTRELILKSFDIVSICCFGPNTFGQTNTSTVSLFLRRKDIEPDVSVHFKNRVETWFSGNSDDDEFYNDVELLETYVNKMGYQFDDYVAMLNGELTESFKSNEIIKDYIKALNIPKHGNDKSYQSLADGAKRIKDEAKKYISRKQYKDLSQEDKEKYIADITTRFIREIEKEKLYYYLLVTDNSQPVLVIQSPANKTDEKKFLGYEWSNRKGAEGIHYLNTGIIQSSGSDDEDSDDDTLQQIKGVNGISTPLFNPLDLNDDSKINNYIRCNYNNEDFDVSDESSEFVNQYSLSDLIDFSRVEFDKVIKTTAILEYPQIETSVENKEKLKVVAPLVTEKISLSNIDVSTYVTTDNMLQNRGGVKTYDGVPNITRITKYKEGDILVSNIRPYLKKIWLADKDGGCSNDVLVFRNSKPNEITSQYLYEILATDIFFDYMMTGKTGLKMPRGDKKTIPNFVIPIPSPDIQKKIADECKKVDEDVLAAKEKLSSAEEKLTSIINNISKKEVRLDNICDIKGGKRIPKGMSYANSKTNHPYLRVSDFKDGSIDLSDIHYISEPVFEIIKNYTISSEDVYISIAGTIGLVGIIPRDLDGANLTENAAKMIIKDHNSLIKEYLWLIFNSPRVQLQIEEETKSIGVPKLALHRIESLMIPYVDKTKQEEIVKKATPLLKTIANAKSIVQQSPNRKQAILDKYLK